MLKGFDSGIYRMDDLWISKDELFAALRAFELPDRLFNHEERRIIKHNRQQEEIERLNARLNTFYESFAASLMNIFGFVTFKNFDKWLAGV